MRKLLAAVAVAFVAALILPTATVSATASAAALPAINGAGSTWSQNALDQWRADVTRLGLKVNYQGVGSTSGRTLFTQGQLDYAVSEIPYQPGESKPSFNFVYLPIVAGGTSVMYRVKGSNGQQITSIKMSSNLTAKIFTRKITKWNDAAIAKENPGVALPNKDITVVVRSDGSGTSYQFSAYLQNREPALWKEFAAANNIPNQPTSNWPTLTGASGQPYSDGVANYVARGDGAITYVEASYAIERKVPVAAIKNQDGNYTLPTAANVAAALTKARLNPDRTQVLTGVYTAGGQAYPISSYSYMLAKTSDIKADKGQAISEFVYYFACAGQKKAAPLGYSPLPVNLVKAAFEAIVNVPGASKPPVISPATCPNPYVTGTTTVPGGSTPTTTVPQGSNNGGGTDNTGGGTDGGGTNGGGTGSTGGGTDGGGTGSTGGGTDGGSGAAAEGATIDIDGDGVADGIDADGDGIVDATLDGVELASSTNRANPEGSVRISGDGTSITPLLIAAACMVLLIVIPPLLLVSGARSGSLPPVPNLLVVIDEYAALASDDANEEAVARLNQVAIQGRSLGVHMLLAMQSPQGVVSNAIQKNTNLWLCLRVADSGESTTVLTTKDAALIPDSQPGRGYLRLGGGGDHPVAFQTASVTSGDDGSAVDVAPFGDLQPPVTAGAVIPSSGGKPLAALCSHLVDEASRLAVAHQRQLWLPPLPTVLADDEPALAHTPSTERLEIVLGLADHPETQQQLPHVVDLSRSGNLLVIGELGSGKTTTLQRVAAAVAADHDAGSCHLYGIEAGGGALAPVRQLPHTAAVVAADDLERSGRLLDRLTSLLDRRREEMSGDGAGDWLRWRTRAATHQPWIVLLVDDYPVFREAVEDHKFGVMLEQFSRLLQSGPQVGIHLVVATTQRSDLRTAIMNLFGARAVLRQADLSDYDLGGIRGRGQRSYEPVPGRALVDPQALREVQVAWPAPETFTDLAAAAAPVPPAEAPRPIERLPKEVPLADVMTRSASIGPRAVPLGLGGAELDLIAFDHATMGPHLLVLGDDLSGRTNTVRVALAAAPADARIAVILGRSSPLASIADDPRVVAVARADDGGEQLLAEVAADPTFTHLAIDDAELIPSPLTGPLDALLRSARDRDLRTVITARASDFSRLFDPWARYLLSFKTGLLLQPTADLASVLDVRLPRGEGHMGAGRGYLVSRGELTLVQVALADP